MDYKSKIEAIKLIREEQDSQGEYGKTDYMIGLYNGIELALSMLEDREPLFKEAHGIIQPEDLEQEALYEI